MNIFTDELFERIGLEPTLDALFQEIRLSPYQQFNHRSAEVHIGQFYLKQRCYYRAIAFEGIKTDVSSFIQLKAKVKEANAVLFWRDGFEYVFSSFGENRRQVLGSKYSLNKDLLTSNSAIEEDKFSPTIEYVVFPVDAFLENDPLSILRLTNVHTESFSTDDLLDRLEDWDRRYGLVMLNWNPIEMYLQTVPKNTEELFSEFVEMGAYLMEDGFDLRAWFDGLLPIIQIDPKSNSY